MAAILDWSVFQTGGNNTITDADSGNDANVTVTTNGMSFFADGGGSFGTSGFIYGTGNTQTTTDTTDINFGENVRNLEFELMDVDGGSNFSDAVTIAAVDADGNPVAVNFSSVDPAYQTVVDNGDGTYTVYGTGSADPAFNGAGDADSVFVSFDGPVSSLQIIHSAGPTINSSGAVGINDLSFDIVCFTPGTQIATPLGDVAVEDLKEGDLVVTKDSGIQAVRWIGRKKVSGARLQSYPQFRPVKICKDAFGIGLPNRDMHVSPQHRVLLAGADVELNYSQGQALAPAKGLITDGSVTVDYSVKEVEYIHILFDKHELVFSDGLLTESFHPGEMSIAGLDDGTRQEVFELFPDLRTNYGAYGPAARMSLSVSESQALVA